MWVRRGVTVWRAPPASSLPRPHAPSRGAGSFLSRHQAAIGRYAFLRCGEVSYGRLARLRWRRRPGAGSKRVFKNECPGVLFGRPRRRARHDFAERDAEFNLNGRHVLAHRVSRAVGQFESRIVLLHLRNARAPRFEKRVGSSVGPRSPARHSVPGCRAAASDASCDPYGLRARARRPRGAMLAISGFQSTAPAARRGEKCPSPCDTSRSLFIVFLIGPTLQS